MRTTELCYLDNNDDIRSTMTSKYFMIPSHMVVESTSKSSVRIARIYSTNLEGSQDAAYELFKLKVVGMVPEISHRFQKCILFWVSG